MTLEICIAQLNFVVGDLAGNAQKIIDASRTAYDEGARLVLTPELSICGYAAEDLFLRPAFIAACHDAVKRVADELAALKDLTVVVGHPTGGDRRTRSVAVQDRLNAASVLRGGDVVATYAKRELPNYQVFDERRYFTPGQGVCVFEAGGFKIGLLICEDAWFESPARLAREAGAELLAVINASPFHVGKGYEREATMRERVRESGLPLVYAHLVGGQDEVVFEGHSFVVSADAEIAGRAPSFEEKLFYASVKRSVDAIDVVADMVPERALDADLWDALVLGVRDYIGKNGFPGASGLVGRHRLRAGAGGGGGCARARPGARGDDALALHRRHQLDRRPRHGGAAGRALRRDLHPARVRGFQGLAGAAVRRAGRGHDRGEHPGPHPRHAADGLVQQVPARSC
jgi:NAD+ synthase (glutamine-hydrolysing)